MFFYRLKYEFLAQRILIFFWLLALGSFPLFSWLWWDSPLDSKSSNYQGLIVFSFIGVGTILLYLVSSTINRDNLKAPQAFWVTRPIRPNTLYTVKWVYLQLITTLPIAFTASVTAYCIGRVDQAALAATECGLWAICATTLLSYSELVTPKKKAMLYSGSFIAGIILTALVINLYILPRWGILDKLPGHSVAGNLLVTLGLVSATFTLLYFHQVRNKHTKITFWVMPLIGCVATLIVSISPFPINYAISHIIDETSFTAHQVTQLKISGKGDGGGANYLTFSKTTELKNILPIAENFDIMSNDLVIEELSEDLSPFIKLKPNLDISNDNHSLSLSLKIYDRVPKSYGSYSSSSLNKLDVISKLPKKKFRLHGSILVQADHFRDFDKTALGVNKLYSIPGIKMKTHLNRFDDLEMSLTSRRSHMPLISRINLLNNNHSKLSINHPITGVQSTEAGSSSSGGTLGSTSEHHYNILNSLSPDSHELKLFRKQGFSGTLDDWINEASQIVTIYDHSTYHEVNIDMTIEIADPNLVLEYLRNNN